MTQTAGRLSVPDATALAHVQKLCEVRSPYQQTPENDALFVQAMQQIVDWHRNNNAFYARLLQERGFATNKLVSIEDCSNIPFVLANFFKAHEQLSVDRAQITAHMTSSGTTGQKSQMFFDDWSLGAPQRMIDFIFELYGWSTPASPTNYLLYSYETAVSEGGADAKLGTAYTDNFLCKYAPVNKVFSALRITGDGGNEFDVFGCIDKLREFANDGLPVRIFGFPAFLHFTLERMRSLKLPPLKLPAESLVFLGGGWKGHADKQIHKLDLYRNIGEQLGIPDKRIRDGYGSVEHCIPYIECEHHQFHVPIWARVYARDVRSLDVLPYGERGFLHFVSPYITSVPACSVVMGDLASVHQGDSCPCEIQTPYFVVHGRAGVSKNKSCAVAAAELMSKERRSA